MLASIPHDFQDEDYFDDADDCPNCGGEGVVYDCVTDYACVDPESGCEVCARLCDFCVPSRSISVPVQNGESGEK